MTSGSFIDLLGHRFGRLTVVAHAGKDKNKHTIWTTRCECGAPRVVSTQELRGGTAKSCGASSCRTIREALQVGQRIGRLTVAGRAEDGLRRGERRWDCICDCGAKKTIDQGHLLAKNGTRSCGCLTIEAVKKANTTHGQLKTPEYRAWRNMLGRCENKAHNSYFRYGGRGISICDRWKDFNKFVEDMGSRPSPKHSLDRIDNEGNYEPSNCRWATDSEQLRNTSSNLWIEWNGERRTAVEWAEKLGIKVRHIYDRIYSGWEVERVLFQKARKSPCTRSRERTKPQQ